MTEAHQTRVPPAAAILQIPSDGDELVFNSPWEAKAFSLVVQLYQQGHFTWSEWTAQLVKEIEAAGDEQNGRDYYLLWLNAAETLIAAKGLCRADELLARKDTLESAQGGPAPA